MNDAVKMPDQRFRLGWRGILWNAEWLLYADGDTSPVLVFLAFGLVFLPSLFFSYLRLNAEGVALHYWPKYRASFSWDQISHLGQCRALGVFPCDALFLEGPADVPWKESITRAAGLQQKSIIPLSDFRGWPVGRLAEALSRYIPEILS